MRFSFVSLFWLVVFANAPSIAGDAVSLGAPDLVQRLIFQESWGNEFHFPFHSNANLFGELRASDERSIALPRGFVAEDLRRSVRLYVFYRGASVAHILGSEVGFSVGCESGCTVDAIALELRDGELFLSILGAFATERASVHATMLAASNPRFVTMGLLDQPDPGDRLDRVSVFSAYPVHGGYAVERTADPLRERRFRFGRFHLNELKRLTRASRVLEQLDRILRSDGEGLAYV